MTCEEAKEILYPLHEWLEKPVHMDLENVWVELTVCPLCAAFVASEEQHAEWHLGLLLQLSPVTKEEQTQ